MSFLAGALGLSGGVSGGSSTDSKNGTSNNQTSSTGVSTPTYSQPQADLQTSLAAALQSILGGNGYSPQVQTLQTQSADQINQTADATGKQLQKSLAQRGFGSSGLVGDAALKTELGRQSNLATNNANFANLALQQWGQGLSDALQFAFANPGQSSSATGTSNTQTQSTEKQSGTQWGVGVGAKAGFG